MKIAILGTRGVPPRYGGFETFAAELTHLLVNQKLAFNSPVWFNLGVEGTPQQASACFINSVDDSMESIMDLAKTEAMLFKGGSGTGSNLSTIRSSREQLAGGGVLHAIVEKGHKVALQNQVFDTEEEAKKVFGGLGEGTHRFGLRFR